MEDIEFLKAQNEFLKEKLAKLNNELIILRDLKNTCKCKNNEKTI